MRDRRARFVPRRELFRVWLRLALQDRLSHWPGKTRESKGHTTRWYEPPPPFERSTEHFCDYYRINQLYLWRVFVHPQNHYRARRAWPNLSLCAEFHRDRPSDNSDAISVKFSEFRFRSADPDFYGTFQCVTRIGQPTRLRVTVAREIIPNLEAVNAWIIACYSHVRCSVSHFAHEYFAISFFFSPADGTKHFSTQWESIVTRNTCFNTDSYCKPKNKFLVLLKFFSVVKFASFV